MLVETSVLSLYWFIEPDRLCDPWTECLVDGRADSK